LLIVIASGEQLHHPNKRMVQVEVVAQGQQRLSRIDQRSSACASKRLLAGMVLMTETELARRSPGQSALANGDMVCLWSIFMRA
jgi:hypothetical protein